MGVGKKNWKNRNKAVTRGKLKSGEVETEIILLEKKKSNLHSKRNDSKN